MSDICVVGAGPAGSAFAARMALLGHQVWLLERARFPRSHLGESLSADVLPLLESIGARGAVEAAGFRRVRSVSVKWDGALQRREDTRKPGLLVDRAQFDQLLLQRARSLGVRVLQPARARVRASDGGGWWIDALLPHGRVELRADFLAEAGGRCARLGRSDRRTGCRTIALYAYWRGDTLPDHPCIEAGDDAWFWGVPLPDRSFNAQVFVDAGHFRGTGRASLKARFLQLLGRFELAAALRGARLQDAVRAADATPYLDQVCVTASSIKLGDAALALDPISSSGVQKAIQSALAAAVVANTLLRRPSAADAALRFYRATLADASERHCRWAAGHYRSVAQVRGGAFWQARATGAESGAWETVQPAIDVRALAATPVAISERLEWLELPCIEGDFVAIKQAVRHPDLEAPIAYLGGWQLAPLLRQCPPGSTPTQLAQLWSSHMPLSSAAAIAAWLIDHRVLVAAASQRACEHGR